MALAQRSDLLALRRYPVLALWCLFLALEPFYIMPSGLPQPGDVLVLVLVPAALFGWNRRMHRAVAPSVRALVAFTIWVFIINYGWALIEWKWALNKAYTIFPIYYLFNLAIFLTALVLFQRFGKLLLRLTVYVVMIDIAIQVVASIVFGVGRSRSAVFFNNANQLGYYALLAATLISITQRRLELSRTIATSALLGCIYLAMISASRAAVAGIVILLVLLVFANPRIIILASLFAVGLVTIGGPVTQAIENVETRSHKQSRLGFTEERGYDRLWNYREYVPIGAGEGDVARFVPEGVSGLEIHSSFGTVLFSYGIVGMALFLGFLVRVGRGAGFRMTLMLLPTFAHTMSHQGLRFTMLWVMLALFVALKVPAEPDSSSVAP